MVLTTIGLIGFVAVLLTLGSGSPSELHHVALVTLFVAFAIFAIGSLTESNGCRCLSRLTPLKADLERAAN